MNRKIRIGLIGLGTVGSGVFKTLRCFDNVEIVKIAVKNINKPRNLDGLDNSILTDNPYEIVQNERKGGNVMLDNMTLKGLRANVDLSQEEVAESLGISRISYQNTEKGKRKLSLDEGLKLSGLFNVPLEVICRAVGLI